LIPTENQPKTGVYKEPSTKSVREEAEEGVGLKHLV